MKNDNIDDKINNTPNIQAQKRKEDIENNYKFLTAKRQLEEVRLMMTVDANYKLLKKGISIDTKPLEEVLVELKKLEQ